MYQFNLIMQIYYYFSVKRLNLILKNSSKSKHYLTIEVEFIPYYNMKKEGRNRNWIAWIALGLSVIAILLWLCKYEPVNMDSIRFYDCFLSFVVGALAVMVGYNIFTG